MSQDPSTPDAAFLLPHGTPSPLALIGGRRYPGGATFAHADVYTGAKIADVATPTRDQIHAAVVGLGRAVPSSPPPYERARILGRLAELVSARRHGFLELMTAEVGFTPSDGTGEIDRAIDTCRLCAAEATRIAGEVVPLDGNPGQQDRLAFTLRLPVGVVCAITPFNSPVNTVLHKIGPAIAAGNAVLLKPSDRAPLCASLLCDLLLEAGLPPELLALVHGGAEVGQWLLDEPGIDFYTFTGSTRVGRLVQAGAGLRRTQLELGSIACTIVCADADLEPALAKIARASFRKAGQVCTSVQRVYAERPIAAEATRLLAREAAALPAGNPRDAATRVGPMIAEAEARRAESWIAEARAGAARVECGGTRRGAVLEPTVLTRVSRGMRVVDEEIFAPVVSVIPCDGIDDAIRAINETPYGLAAGVFTSRLDTAFRAARGIRAGAVHVNETSSSRVDGMPYGGVKDSGFGREGPRYAIREMTEERVVTFSLGSLRP
jgi:succinate-semialdehyde dehydrogenase / glutarate-semialdehyde dehydrogenase